MSANLNSSSPPQARGGQVMGAFMGRLAQPAPFKLKPQHARHLHARSIAAPSLAQLNAQFSGQSGPRGSNQALGSGPDLRFLLQHGTMGFSMVDYSAAQTLGWSGWLEQQLDYTSIDDSEVEFITSQIYTLGLGPAELLEFFPGNFVEQVIRDLQYAVLLRAIHSKRQLFERLVTFWTDHFNVSQLDELCLWTKTDDDREVVRKHALGTFPEMLKASARSSAMVWYLDNYSNQVGAPQENYARELLELHTLGVDGPYTEEDVREVARCFTGWTLGRVNSSARAGEFTFEAQLHDYGEKTVLGHTIPAGGGQQDGELVLEILSNHPTTAEFISTKMCRWLLMTDPPASLVREVAEVYLRSGGDIRHMLRAILDPAVVTSLPAAQGSKYRQPLHFMIALLRATLTSSTDLLQITYASERFGQTPYWWPSPDGPPDTIEKWGGSVMPRWEFASQFFGGEIHGNNPDSATLAALLQSAPGATTAARINFVLTGGLLDARDEAEVGNYLRAAPVVSDRVLREAFALAASSPSYQFI